MKKIILFLLMFFVISCVYAVNIDDVNSVEIEPGRTGMISFNVENDHNFDVEDVSIILDFKGDIPIAPYYSSAEVFIGELDDGDDERVSFNVIVAADAELGLYKIPVEISYFDEDRNVYDKVDYISVLVASEPNIGVFLDDPNYVIGNSADISVQIVNKGLSGIKFLSVELLKSDFYDIITLDDVYIGDLDSDDFDNADFSLRLNYPLPNRLSLPVKVTYYDSNNNLYSESFNLKANVYSTDQAKQLDLINSPDYAWVFIVVIVIVLFIVYRVIKKKRRK